MDVSQIPGTAKRVPIHSPRSANERIQEEMERNVACFSSRMEDIEKRLAQLDREWDIERTLQANAAALSVVGFILGKLVSRRWMSLPFVVVGFLLQHAVQGWCPPIALFRRLGVRTQREIDQERYALKALRGDFKEIQEADEQDSISRVRIALRAAE